MEKLEYSPEEMARIAEVPAQDPIAALADEALTDLGRHPFRTGTPEDSIRKEIAADPTRSLDGVLKRFRQIIDDPETSVETRRKTLRDIAEVAGLAEDRADTEIMRMPMDKLVHKFMVEFMPILKECGFKGVAVHRGRKPSET